MYCDCIYCYCSCAVVLQSGVIFFFLESCRDAKVDEYGVPLDILTHLSTNAPQKPQYCCMKHAAMTESSRQLFFQSRDKFNRHKLTLLLGGLESKGFVSREVLLAIVIDMLTYYQYKIDKVVTDRIDQLVTESIMTPEEQNRRRNWTLPLCERLVTSQQTTAADSVGVRLSNHQPGIDETNRSAATKTHQRALSPSLSSSVAIVPVSDGLINDGGADYVHANDETTSGDGGSTGGGGCLPVALYDSSVFIEAVLELMRHLDCNRYP